MKKAKNTITRSDTNQTSNDTDAPDGIAYKNLQNINGEEDVELDELEFNNPLFKKKTRLFNSTIDNLEDNEQKTQEDNYDKLAPPTKSKPNPANKSPAMGVKNYGYMDERPRPDSWDSSLSAFNPYAVDTPIREGVPIPDRQRPPSVGIELSESPPRDRMNTSTKSDYSSITDVNPYMMASDKGPQYEDLAGIRASAMNGGRPSAGGLPTVPSAGHKKSNMLYEPAVISSQKVTLHKRTSIDSRGHQYDERSNYCHFIFTILVGILAIIALIVAFLLVFGKISAKRCEECDVTTITNPGKQTGSGGTSAELDKQLAYIKGNLTLLQNVLHANSSITISTLQTDLNKQKALVASLTKELEDQKKVTESLSSEVNNISFINGDPGERGFNGSQGDIGPQGPAGKSGSNFSACVYSSNRQESKLMSGNDDVAAETSNLGIEGHIVSVACSSSNLFNTHLSKISGTDYMCKCSGIPTGEQVDGECIVHYWACPMAT